MVQSTDEWSLSESCRIVWIRGLAPSLSEHEGISRTVIAQVCEGDRLIDIKAKLTFFTLPPTLRAAHRSRATNSAAREANKSAMNWTIPINGSDPIIGQALNQT